MITMQNTGNPHQQHPAHDNLCIEAPHCIVKHLITYALRCNCYQGSSQCLLLQHNDWLPVQLASIVSTNCEAQSGPSLQQLGGHLHKAVQDPAVIMASS